MEEFFDTIQENEESINIDNNVDSVDLLNDVENHENIIKLELENIRKQKEYIATQKSSINESRLLIEEQKTFIESQIKSIESERNNIIKKESQLLSLKTNIDREYEQEYYKKTLEFNNTINQLKKQIDEKKKELNDLITNLDNTREKKIDELNIEIQKLRTLKIAELQKQYEVRKQEFELELQAVEKAKNSAIKMREKEIELRESELAKKDADYLKKIRELRDSESKLRDLEIELQEKEDDCKSLTIMINKRKQNLENDINKRVEDSIIDIKVGYEKRIAELKRINDEYSNKIVTYENIQLSSGGKNLEELAREIKEKNNIIKALQEKYSTYPNESIIIELQGKADGYEILEKQNKELLIKNNELENSKHKWYMMSAELQKVRDERDLEVRRREAICAQIEKYAEEVERLKTLAERPKERAARIESIENPILPIINNTFDSISEIEWLDIIYKKCEESGINFNKRLLTAFHTALKTSDWSPLTILAGVSGTGKSELPRLYSRFGGMYYIPLAVQPDWDSPQSLVGYFNSIDNRFNATELLRAMVQCQNSTNERIIKDCTSDKMLLVLLDEMNLAHVELYFSDLLSKLETRRGETKPVYLEVDLGAGENKYKVELCRNVLWIGTMNEDETTKSLSDKVLDRGSLISFPRPVKFERRKRVMLAKESPMLKRELWNNWLNEKLEFTDELDKYKECLESINSKLEIVGRALGHRVWQAIENYISNHPMVIQATKSDDINIDRCIQLAFEEALVYKVMPKLRGIETDGDSKYKCLNEIKKELVELLPNSLILEDFEIACQSAYGIFTWKSAKYLEESYGE